MNTFLKSTAGWGMILCVLAAVSPAFPWNYQWAYDLLSAGAGFPRQLAMSSNAYVDWHGAAITVAAGIGFLFLVATGTLHPVPWWRTLGIAIVGVSIIVFTIIYSTRHWNHFPVREFGGLLAIVSSTGLLFIACLEVRRRLDKQPNA